MIKKFKDFNRINENESDNPQKHKYMMLGRLQSDCEYFLGNAKGSEKVLYYDSVEEHISEMKKLWNELDVKPEWLSMEDINEYEEKMLNYSDNSDGSEDHNTTNVEDIEDSEYTKDIKDRLDRIRKNLRTNIELKYKNDKK